MFANSTLGENALGETSTSRSMTMSQAFPGQVANAVVRMYDADGRETDDWDVTGGIAIRHR